MTKVEVVAIGEEVLSGMTVNTNAAFISQELLKAGLSVHRHSVLSDDPVVLGEGLQEALNRSQIIICTGGLGPTLDDCTRQVAAKLFESDFSYFEEIEAELKTRYGTVLVSLRDQATLPSKAKLLKNPIGTACGLVFRDHRGLLILMPGVPVEMRKMLVEQVIPYLIQIFPVEKRWNSLSIHLYGISESGVDPLLRQLKEKYSNVEFGIYPNLGLLTVQVKCLANSEENAKKLLLPIYNQIKEAFAKHVYESPSGKIEETVQQLFIERGYTLSLAESCTGGAIAERLTSLSGSSAYFVGGIVAYSNELKQTILGVSEQTLKEKGAVSPEIAEEMLTGVLELTKSDFAISVTGIAGPTGGTVEKPVGTIWAAIGGRERKPYVWQVPARGNREMIIQRSVNAVLFALLRYVQKQ